MTEVPDLSFDDAPQHAGYVVYKLTCIPTGKIYIGITGRTALKRFSEHVTQSRCPSNAHDKRHIFNALRKYPPDLWTVEVIASAISWDDLCRLEIGFIATFKAQDRKFGYNSTAGGEGTLGLVFSEETKRKMSANRKGKRHSPETIKLLKSFWLDPEFRKRALSGLKNYKQTDQQKERRAAKLRGKKRTLEQRLTMSASMLGKTKTMSLAEYRRAAERDAAICAAHFRAGSLKAAGNLFGIKPSAVCSAIKRVHDRITESVAASGNLLKPPTRPMMIHPDWLDLAI